MNQDLLTVLDHIEREKGIKKEVLIQAVESALLSAARKSLGRDVTDIKVELDRETGDIKILDADNRSISGEFGRIAAQTAKQVIIQKIREAEREVVFEEYQHKVGDIASGGVHRFEKQNIIVDLGRTEGILPKKEVPLNETYKPGDRVKALIIEVKKTSKGPQILLSRTSEVFVKRLFELEVPEIYEGVVEIKAISREPGDRTKIAVYSKDEKVDSVGSCVGMRGQRVKNIVRELGGEKIDIIRWSQDQVEFISQSLSPAEIISVKLAESQKRAEVIVADDQLSLAIGKKGQNVRLAAKLTGWNIDIRSKSEIAKIKEVALSEIKGVGLKTEKLLKEAGFDSVEKIARSNLENLTKVKGIGKKTAEKIIKAAKELLEEKVHEVRQERTKKVEAQKSNEATTHPSVT